MRVFRHVLRPAALVVLLASAVAYPVSADDAKPPVPNPAPAPVTPAASGFDPPAEIKPANGVATYKPPASVVSALYIGLDAEEPLSLEVLGGDPRTFAMLTRGIKEGKYRFVGVGSDKAGNLTRKDFAVVVGTPPIPPIPVPPGPGPNPPVPPGPNPPVVPGKVASFVVVEDPGAAGQWRGDVLGSPQVAAYYKQAGLRHRLISIHAADPDGGQAGEVAYYVKQAAGKELPMLFTLDGNGKELTRGKAPTEAVAFVQAIGGTSGDRAMGNIEPPEGKLQYKWTLFGDTPNTPIYARTTWKNVDLSTFLPAVKDQDGIGACNPFATCTAFESGRNQAGLDPVTTSPGYVYGNINGGRDVGSLLEDSLAWMIEHGTVTAATVPPLAWKKNQWPASAAAESKNYRVVEAYLCPNFDAMASALQQGFFIVEGLLWYNNFVPDRDGWLPARGTGNPGGHALCGYGLVQRNGVWGIRTRNSWGGSWGNGGNCVIPESLFGKSIGGFWAVRSVTQTPTKFPFPNSRLLSPIIRENVVHVNRGLNFSLAF